MNIDTNVLIVDDNPADSWIMEAELQRAPGHINTYVAENGELALKYLRRETPFENIPVPNLIILDLNLPGLDGHSVLETIKKDPLLRKIPVVIFSSSDTQKDICKAYSSYANSYFSKPFNLGEFQKTLKQIKEYWLNDGVKLAQHYTRYTD